METLGPFKGGTQGIYWGYIGIMDKKKETTIVDWGYIEIMEKKMATL